MPATKYSFTCKDGRIEEVQSRFTATVHRLVSEVAADDSKKAAKWNRIESGWSEGDALRTIRKAVRRHECRFIDEGTELGVPPDAQQYQDTTVEMKAERLDAGKDKDRIVIKFKQKYFDWITNKGKKSNERTFQALLVVSTNVLTFGDIVEFKTEGRIT